MSSWGSEFRKFCSSRLTEEETQLWKTVRQKLINSIELHENLFPKTVVGTVLITLNGRVMSIQGSGEESSESYYYGLNPDDLTAVNGMVRLNDRYMKKAFETKAGLNLSKSYEFMYSFIKTLQIDAFTKSIQLKADLGILSGALSMYNIPKITVNSNPILCTLDLITGDYILAKEHPEKYAECVAWQDPNTKVSIAPYVKSQLNMTTVNSVSDSIDYYLVRGLRKHTYKSEFTTFFTLPKGLTDVVPVAVKFPEEAIKETKSGITMVNNLDSIIFDTLCNKNLIPIKEMYCDYTGLTFAENAEVEFNERLMRFKESVSRKVFSAPSLSGSFDNIVQVACATKKDIFELTDIQFYNYSFGIMNFILSAMLREEVGSLMPYSVSRTVSSPFNNYLKSQITFRNRVSNFND